jgi:hypothetical protein
MKTLYFVLAALLFVSSSFAQQYDQEVISNLKAIGLDSVVYYKGLELKTSDPGKILPMKNNQAELIAEVTKLEGTSFVFIRGKADRPGSLERNYVVAAYRAEWVKTFVANMNVGNVTAIVLTPKLNQDVRGAEVIVVTAVSTKKTITQITNNYKMDTSVLESRIKDLEDDQRAFMSAVNARLELAKKSDNSLSERVRFGLGLAGSYGSVHRATYGPSTAISLPMFGISYIQLRAYGLGSYEGQAGVSLTMDANIRVWRDSGFNEWYITAGANYTSYKNVNKNLDKYMEGGLYGGLTYNIPIGEYNVVNFSLLANIVGNLDIQHQGSTWSNHSIRPMASAAFWF